MDEDLASLSPGQLVAEIRRMRDAIRKHRDASGHELCWHQPQLWSLLPESTSSPVTVPAWPQFIRGCVRYRQSLDEQLPDEPRSDGEFSV